MDVSTDLSSETRQRLRQSIELAAAFVLGLLFFAYGPFWYWSVIMRISLAAGLALAVLAIYHGLRKQFLYRRDETDTAGDQNTEVSLPHWKKRYQVPRRFSLQTMVATTFVFALLASGLKSLGTDIAFNITVLSLVATICAFQIFMNRVPRFASALAGASFFAVLFAVLNLNRNPSGLPAVLIGSMIVGAVLGYLTGVCVAGLFLIADLLSHWWTSDQTSRAAPNPPRP